MSDVFSQSFSNIKLCIISSSRDFDFVSMSLILVDHAGILKAIERLKLSSSPGIDKINSRFLQNTKIYSSLILQKIYQQYLYEGVVRNDWKIAKFIPLDKSAGK